jgi:hypothetical protein
MKKYILIALAVALLVVGYIWFFVWNKAHRTAADEAAFAKVTAHALFLEFAADDSVAFGKYKDKVIQVSGVLQEVKQDASGDTELVMNTEDESAHVIVTLKKGDMAVNAQVGTTIEIKGICNGFMYEELLEQSDVLLNQGVLVEKTKEK